MSKTTSIPVPTRTLLDRSGIKIEADKEGLCGFLSYVSTSAVPTLSVPILKAALKKAGVVYGIDEEAMTKVSGASEEINRMLIARGEAPVKGGDSELEYNFDIDPYHRGGLDQKEKVEKLDFKNRGPLPYVKAGDVVATMIHKRPPCKGKSVTGEEIDAGFTESPELQPGNNVKVEKRNYIAAIDGGPRLDKENRVEIQAEWTINGDVELKTGNISFPGPVIVKGLILAGFEVHCKSLVAEGIENSTVIEVEESIVLEGGIQGGKITCGGKLISRYINNASVLCASDVIVKLSIINSDVRCSGSLEAQTVFGGTITSRKGVTCLNLSSEANRSTVIFGLDPIKQKNISEIVRQKIEVEEKLAHLRDKVGPILIEYEELKKLEAEVKPFVAEVVALKQRMKALNPEDTESLEFFELRLEEIKGEIGLPLAEIKALKTKTSGIQKDFLNEMMEIKDLTRHLNDLEAQQNEISDKEVVSEVIPKVIVKGKALAGTRVSSSHARMLLRKDMQRVVFSQRKVMKQDQKKYGNREYYLSYERL